MGVFIPSFLIFWDHRAFCRRALLSTCRTTQQQGYIGGVTNRTQFSEYFKELVRHCAALEKAEAHAAIDAWSKGSPILDFVLNFVFLLLCVVCGSLFRDIGDTPHHNDRIIEVDCARAGFILRYHSHKRSSLLNVHTISNYLNVQK